MACMLLSFIFLSQLFLFSGCADQYQYNTPPETVLRADGGTRISGFSDRTDKDFIFGGLFPIHLTATGGAQCSETFNVRGLERTEAMLHAIDTINSDPNLLPNITLGYDIRDTCMSFNIALDETADLLVTGNRIAVDSCQADNASNSIFTAVIGAAASTVSIPVATFLRLYDVPQVSYSSSSPTLNNRDRYSYFYRTIPSDDQQARAMIDLILNFQWDHISIIYSNNPYGEPSSEQVRRLAQSNGICVDLNEAIDESFAELEYREIASKIVNSSANVIVLFASINHAKMLFKEVNDIQSNDERRNFVWIASDSWVASSFIQTTYPNIVAGMWGTAPSTSFYRPFDEYLSQLTNETNNRNPFFGDEYFERYFNCSLVSCNNISATESDLYTQEVIIPLVVDAVYSIAHSLQNFLNENCQSPIVWYSSNQTCAGQNPNITLNGQTLLQYLRNVNFTSPSGRQVSFDEFGSVPANYSIYNYQLTSPGCQNCTTPYSLVNVAYWDGSASQNRLQFFPTTTKQFGVNQSSGDALLLFNSQCQQCSRGYRKRQVMSSCCGVCDPCLGPNYTNSTTSTECQVCPRPDNMWGNDPLAGSTGCVDIEESYLRLTDAWAIVLIILAIIGLLAVAFVVGVFVWFWNTPIVKSSGREQMILLLIGITSCFLITVFFVVKPSPAVCGLQRIGFWFSYSLILCALFVKLVRIARIFLRQKVTGRPKFITPIYQILFTFILVGFQMILVLISLVVVNPDVDQIRQLNGNDQNDFPVLLLLCTQSHIALIAIQIAFFSALLIASNALAILTIRFPNNFNESKYVASSTFAAGVMWIAFISTYFATDTINQTAVISFTVQVSALAILACMFGPRVVIMIALPSKNMKTATVSKSDDEAIPKSNAFKLTTAM